MDKREQRIAIAKACGFNINRIDRNEDGEIKFIWCKDYPAEWKGPNLRPWPPEFTCDLNAMHEAEKSLSVPTHSDYICQLYYKTMGLGKGICDWQELATATAAQRAEAFLKTLNLWK